MYYALITFKNVPKLGFAHHFYAESYDHTRQKIENNLEIVYIKKGNLTISLGEKTMLAKPGSVCVLLRTMPLHFKIDENSHHTHCSVQVISDFEFKVTEDINEVPDDYPGLIIPFITEPCDETEIIKKQLFSIVSELSVSRDLNEFSASLSAMGILEALSSVFKKSFLKETQNASLLCYKIKRYVYEHLHESILLSDIEKELGKTSIYLNAVFKKESGTTIHQYINREKMRLVAELMDNKGISFKNACENAGIKDISYGYRMFKKQIGITPAEYKSSVRFGVNVN